MDLTGDNVLEFRLLSAQESAARALEPRDGGDIKQTKPLVCSKKRPSWPDSMRVAGAVDRPPFDPEIVGKLGSPRLYSPVQTRTVAWPRRAASQGWEYQKLSPRNSTHEFS
jgi:hypothetical protein